MTKKYVVLELAENVSQWDVLELCKQNGIEIKHFGAYEPSLNDIFVSRVGEEVVEEEDKTETTDEAGKDGE